MHSLAETNSLEKYLSEKASVKFVYNNREPDPVSEAKAAAEDIPRGFEPEVCEPIDGCTEEDFGWMRIASWMINADTYDAFTGDRSQWMIFYERPPSIVVY